MTSGRRDPVRTARNAAQRRARASLERLVPDQTERELYAEAVERYVAAVALGAKIRQEWESLGEPMLEEGSMRQPIPHPLVKMIADADREASRYSANVGLDPGVKVPGRKVGRPAGAASAPDRAAAPPKLRSVK